MVCYPTRQNVLVACSVSADACHRGVARFAREHNWHVVADMKFSGAFPRGWRGDGIIALPGLDSNLLRFVAEAGVPVVGISLSDEELPFPYVAADQKTIAQHAAEHLLTRAFRHFAFAPFSNDPSQSARHACFEQCLRESGRECRLLPLAHRRVGAFWRDDWAEYRQALDAAIGAMLKPVAILAGNDVVGAEILEICNRRGFSVPEEVAVLGVGNDVAICETAAFPLSSVQLDVEQLSFAAASLLKKLLDGCAVSSAEIRVPSSGVVTRISTERCAVSNPRVAQALNYIAENYSDAMLSVAGIASILGVSRRQLERSFRQTTGVTLSEEIAKRRMQEASRLLRTHSRATMTEIAGLVGFSDVRTFFRTFRKHFRQSPSLHRAQARSGGAAGTLSQILSTSKDAGCM